MAKQPKIIKNAELKKMNLTEQEFIYMEDVVNDINKKRDYTCESTKFFAFGSISKDERNAYRKAIEYFAVKFTKESGSNKLDEIASMIAKIFFTSTYLVITYLKGIDADHNSSIIVEDNFGLNYIAIKK